MKDFDPPPPIVSEAESEDRRLIDEAKNAMSTCHFTVGRCASVWCERYSLARNDAKFGDLIGMSGAIVRQCRVVWERFSNLSSKLDSLTWTHFREALAWDDADECLAWAEENQASVAEMKAWRAANRGEPFDPPEVTPDNDHNLCDAETEETPRAPVAGSRNRDSNRAAATSPANRSGTDSPAESPSAPSPAPAEPQKSWIRRLVDLFREIDDEADRDEKTAIAAVLAEWVDVFKPQKKRVSASKKKYDPRTAVIPQDLMQGTFPQIWEDWIEHREEIKKPMTKKATEMALRKLENWGAARSAAALRHSIQNGYQGIFEPTGPQPDRYAGVKAAIANGPPRRSGDG